MTFITKRSFSHRLDNVQKYPKMWKYVLRATSRQSLTCAKKILSGDIFMQDRCLLYFAERVTGEVVSII